MLNSLLGVAPSGEFVEPVGLVSIHAPREGCDLSAPELFYFDIQFQFTHPGRGATCGIVLSATQHLEFQFTHPGRGATILLGKAGELWMVSIHAPREGCDPRCVYGRWEQSVSIHAPREGCDFIEVGCWSSELCFNSRTPGGVRPFLSFSSLRSISFQFTHPGRGATPAPLQTKSYCLPFQFTHPGRGATLLIHRCYISMSFQFTHPGRGATVTPARLFAPHPFQFTHPGRGATLITDKT